jgi:acyl carrier protein
MKKSEFLVELARVLMAEGQELTDATPLSSLPGWDSMGMLGVFSLIDEKLDTKLPAGSLQKCTTVGDILVLVSSRLSL